MQSPQSVMRFIWQAGSGKRIVIEDFPAEQKSLLLSCTVCVTESQKQMMAEALEEKLQVRLQKYDYEEYFNRIKSGGPEKLILVIDEFSYIAKKIRILSMLF